MKWLLVAYLVGFVVTALIVWRTAREPSAGEVATTLLLWPFVLPLVGLLWVMEVLQRDAK